MINETLLFAILLMLEAGGEPWRGKAAVADTVITRQRQSGKSLTEVMLAPKQFSCFNNTKTAGKFAADVAAGQHRNDQSWKDCMAIAELACRPGYRVKVKATHYYAPARLKRAPYWAKAMREVAVIAGHRFMIEKKGTKLKGTP